MSMCASYHSELLETSANSREDALDEGEVCKIFSTYALWLDLGS